MIHVTLLGNLGADAELKELPGPNKTIVLECRVACTVFNGKERETQWVRVNYFGARAEAVAGYLTKGKTVCVVGQMHTRQYEGQNGTGFSVEVKADDIQLAGSPSGNGARKPNGASEDADDFPHGANEPAARAAAPAARKVAPKPVKQATRAQARR